MTPRERKSSTTAIIRMNTRSAGGMRLLSCREPLPGTHERYVAAKWRQVVGSTMHCVAGDGIGILAAAVITYAVGVQPWVDLVVEYVLGFLFGWMVFQALFMKSMFGSYRESMKKTFIAELLSMNAVMGGMTAVMIPWMTNTTPHPSPTGPTFWFIMSIALCAGFLVALPMNWWLVDRGLKHGMLTVRHDKPVPLPRGSLWPAPRWPTVPEPGTRGTRRNSTRWNGTRPARAPRRPRRATTTTAWSPGWAAPSSPS
ncbi:DUF4396 domain-containing protein [Streptomyces hydrogenans]|uniref:DUF4396 domain-containing protein n=1 Tax=Streptomyces hydrogenans TaxID=1873719 RepID=UPI0035E3BCF3